MGRTQYLGKIKNYLTARNKPCKVKSNNDESSKHGTYFRVNKSMNKFQEIEKSMLYLWCVEMKYEVIYWNDIYSMIFFLLYTELYDWLSSLIYYLGLSIDYNAIFKLCFCFIIWYRQKKWASSTLRDRNSWLLFEKKKSFSFHFEFIYAEKKKEF